MEGVSVGAAVVGALVGAATHSNTPLLSWQSSAPLHTWAPHLEYGCGHSIVSGSSKGQLLPNPCTCELEMAKRHACIHVAQTQSAADAGPAGATQVGVAVGATVVGDAVVGAAVVGAAVVGDGVVGDGVGGGAGAT